MGLFVHLFVHPKVAATEWENAFQQAQTLLAAFPAKLFHVASTDRGKARRYILTPNLVRNPGSFDEKIEVAGDLDSGLFAETFGLFRKWERYLEKSRETFPEKSITFAPSGDLGYPNSLNGICLFSGKTQGYPYQLALIAIGTLIENAFPNKAVCRGDFDRLSAEKVRQWVESVLGRRIAPLLCFDAFRLFSEISKAFPNHRDQAERFQTLFAGSESETISALLTFLPRDDVQAYFAQNISSYSSHQVGATNVLKAWMCATQSLEDTIRFFLAVRQACVEDETRETWSLDALLEILCQEGIMIPPPDRLPKSPWPDGFTPNIEETITFTLLQLGRTPLPESFPWIEETKLLEVFALAEPQNRKKFSHLIETSRKKYLRLSGRVRSKMKKLLPVEKPAVIEPLALSPQEYIIAQVDRQSYFGPARRRSLLKEFSDSKTQEALKGLLEKEKEVMEGSDRATLLRHIAAACEKNGIPLTEEAWDWLDTDASLEMLHFVHAFTAVSYSEIRFSRARRFLLSCPSFMRECLPWIC